MLKKLIILFICFISLFSTVNAETFVLDETYLNNYIIDMANEVKDPWAKAVYEAGTTDILFMDNKVSFKLRDFNPKIKSLPNYKNDIQAWSKIFFDNISNFNLECELNIENNQFTKKSLDKLKNKVNNAVKKTKADFQKRQVMDAIISLYLPEFYTNTDNVLKSKLRDIPFTLEDFSMHNYIDNPKYLAPFFYGQRSKKLNIKGGPHSLVISYKGINPETLVEEAYAASYNKYSKTTKSNKLPNSVIEEDFLSNLLNQSIKLRKNPTEESSFTFDLDIIKDGKLGDDYNAFLSKYNVSNRFNTLLSEIRSLPDYVILDYPKTGRISGSDHGTVLVILPYKSKYASYYQLIDKSGYVVVDCFIRPG